MAAFHDRRGRSTVEKGPMCHYVYSHDEIMSKMAKKESKWGELFNAVILPSSHLCPPPLPHQRQPPAQACLQTCTI